MTNTNGDRLNRFEDDLETVKSILLTVARQYEASETRLRATDERIDRLVNSQDRTQRQLDKLTEDVDIAFQTIGALSNNTDRAIDSINNSISGINNSMNGINATLASVNAAIERQDKILDYLLKRDGNSS